MSDDTDTRMPYQLPFPKDALDEIVIPNAIPTDERLWVPQAENVWFRPLCLNRSQGYWMNLLRVRKSGVLSRHRHPQPVHGFVLKGRWHYLEHDWVAEEGGYVFEPPGETHTLVWEKITWISSSDNADQSRPNNASPNVISLSNAPFARKACICAMTTGLFIINVWVTGNEI
jgi:quercetin dioxygenase-like cupin family protein